jgi:hypothetical protein
VNPKIDYGIYEILRQRRYSKGPHSSCGPLSSASVLIVFSGGITPLISPFLFVLERRKATMLFQRPAFTLFLAAVVARNNAVPALCYDPCENAQIEGNFGHWARSLCNAGTAFRQNLEDCLACIDANELGGVSLDDLGAFGGAIGFCL